MTQCVNGSLGGGCCPFNYIGINIGGQLVPFRQVSLSSVQLRVVELQTLSRSLYSVTLFPDGSRPLLFRGATPAASKHLPGDEHIPRVLSVTDPDPITACVPSAERSRQKPAAGYREKRVREKRLRSGFKRKLTFTYSPPVSAEPFRLKKPEEMLP